MKELKETVGLMLSKDYEDRFKAEYEQTKIRRDKLRKMLDDFRANTLNFTPKSNTVVLQEQLYIMDLYVNILKVRAKEEEIELEDK